MSKAKASKKNAPNKRIGEAKKPIAKNQGSAKVQKANAQRYKKKQSKAERSGVNA